MKHNGWFSHSWFNHPLLCILSVYLKELLSAGERKTQHFAVKSLGFLDTLFQSLLLIMKTLAHLLLPSLLIIFRRLSGEKFIFSKGNYS